jgi:hypothetical protein
MPLLSVVDGPLVGLSERFGGHSGDRHRSDRLARVPGVLPVRGVDLEALRALLDHEVAVALEVLAVAREPQPRLRRLHPELVDELLGVGG